MTIGFVLQPDRASRMVAQNAVDPTLPGLGDVIDRLTQATFDAVDGDAVRGRRPARDVAGAGGPAHLDCAGRAGQPGAGRRVAQAAAAGARAARAGPANELDTAHHSLIAADIKRFLERPAETWRMLPAPFSPPGAPIGGDVPQNWLATADLVRVGRLPVRSTVICDPHEASVGCDYLLLASVTVATLAAQRRITTHPAEPYLKQLFANAAAISGHEGTPLHWKIYGEDPAKNPKAQPIALAFWSTDIVPLERGYNGPTHLLVGMDMSGIIVGAVMAYSSDPYAYFSVEPPEFAAQFKGKSIRAPFRVGDDIHAVSRATLIDVERDPRHPRQRADDGEAVLNPANVK